MMNAPLLQSHDTTTNARLGDLRLVERDDGRRDADSETGDDTADDEHATVLDRLEVSWTALGEEVCQKAHLEAVERSPRENRSLSGTAAVISPQ